MNNPFLSPRKNRGLAVVLIITALTAITLSGARAGVFDLGQAAGYVALSIPGSSNNMVINGGAAVVGDVGVAGTMHLDLGSLAKVGPNAGTGRIVGGFIYLNPGATVNLQHQPPNTVIPRNLSQAVADAIAANQAAAGLTVTQNLGDLDIGGGNFTVTGNGGCNVIRLDSFKLHGGGSLTISGSASDVFVFNIYGNYSISGGGTMFLTGGVQASNILWNYVGTGNAVDIGLPEADVTGHGTFYGTYLAPNRAFGITDSTLVGAIISRGDLKITSNALVVPESVPNWMILGALVVLGILSRRTFTNRRHS